MPVFTPINPPPPASQDDAPGSAGQAAPAARLEEDIRGLIRRYQAALRQWLRGQHQEACAAFNGLAESALLVRVQELHVESESSAYCKEHGGLSIARLRSLVLANAGVLRLTVEAGGLARHLLGSLGFDERTRLAADADDSEVEAVGEALTQLTAALAFDQANTAHRLAAGQCAMALGRHDVALSVLGEALGPAADADPRLPERRWGPLKWWCARAAVQAALMRGDAQLAAGLVQSTSKQSRSASEELQRLVDALVVLPASSSAPAVFRIPGAAAARRPPAVVPACVLTIQPTGDLVPLATFGEELVSYYRQCATGCPDAGTAAILGHVPLELCAVAAAPGGEMESADTGMQVGGDMSEAETDVRDHQPEPAAECQSYTDVDDAGSGIDCPAGGDVCRAPKRRASSSGDEMPAKRRSTRFSERSTSTAVAGTHGASSSGPALPPAGGRPAAAAAAAATRGGVRHALTVFPTAAVSAASNEASESAQVWLGAVDVASGQAAANSTSLCAALAEISCRQEHPGRRHKAQGRTPSGPDRDALADWNIDPRSRGGGSSKSSGTDALEAALQSIASPSANYHLSLAAHLGQQRSGPSDSALPGAGSPPPCHSLSIPECQALVGENSGVFDLLLRYIRAATEAFWESPLAFLQSTRLKLATLAVVRIAHGLLLDWAIRGCSADGSADDIRQGLRCGTLVIMLLADPLVGGTSHQQQQTSAMRTQWIVVAEDAVSRIMHQADDPCVAQYRMARAWSDYEAAVASNDTAQAATSVAACIDLLQRHADGSGGAPVARCSLSGMVVTLELARQRQAHLEFFGQLGIAAELARADERQAVAFLRSIAEPFADGAASALAFPQQVAATRLLAVLCGRQGMPEDAARATLYELHLYLSRLLAGPADAAMPVRLVVGRCAECLQAVHAMAATGSPVDQYLDSPAAQVPLRRVAGQLVPMAIALANHFEVGPAAAERATTSPEAKFVGLAAWLAARVTAGTPPASPLLPAGQLAAAPSECSDGAEALDGYMRFLSDIHALLGERGLCTAADGAFLKHVLAVCRRRLARDSDSPAHWDVAGSCLRCLFDIRLHSSSAEHHPSARVEMDQQLANAVYLLVETELLDTLRSRKGAGLRSDLKAVVDKAGSVLGSVDIAEHPRLRMNMDAIDDYLDGATMPTFAQLELALRGDGSRALHVSCVPLRGTADDISIPAACLSLPFVRATMQHQLLLFRMRSGLARAVEDYDEIIEDYKLNVSLNPGSAEAWHHLGQAHSDLADELLLGTASEILDSRYDIATLLRSALSCVLQAKQQLEPIGSPGARESKPCNSDGDGDGDGDSTGSSDSGEPPGQLHGRVYSLAGRLLYRIAARPLPMLALEILPSNILVADDSPDGRQAWDVGTWGPGGARAEALSQSLERRYCAPPPSRRVYALAHDMLLRATRLEPKSWKPVYMLGKATAKLGRPLAACALYLKACLLACAAASAPLSVSSMPEGAAHVLCKLLSTLVKLVWSQKTDAATAQRFLDALSVTVASSTLTAETAPSVASAQLEARHPDAAPRVFAAIRDALDQMCGADKRRRHHQPAFLLAWLCHHVFSDSEQAKHTLLGLLQMRGAGKQLASFYKTDFEAAGKHYLYLEKYLLLYIDTLTATLDIGGIRALARKLQRTADMLYDAPAMLRRVGAAEMAILQGMVRGLNCPRLAGSGTGEEQIVLQLGNGSAEAQTRAVFRHSRLNRTQFNYARDFARENIVRITAVRQHIRAALACAEATAPTAEVPTLDTATMRDALTSADQDTTGYLETADKAVALFGHLLDQKKHADDPEALSQLNDNVADVYALVLSTYGQSRCAAHTPLPHEATPADICRHASELLAQAPRPASPSGPFWRCITFDEARHDGSQQYKLLDPLLEFQVNKLLDSVHAAQARTGSSPAQDSQAPPAAASPEDPSLAAAGDGIPAQVL